MMLPSMTDRHKVLILGIGNLLWADEGFGVRVIEQILKNYSFPDQVTVMDGGTQGMYLVQHIQEADILIVFDAIDFDLPAGEIKLIYNEDVPSFMGAKKMSLHQTGFQEVLAMAQMLGTYPEHLLLIGVQPQELDDYGGSLRPLVKSQIQPAIDFALQYLVSFGTHINALDPDTAVKLTDPMLDILRYEAERPPESVACRLGDERVVYSPNVKIVPPSTPEGAIPIDVDFRGQY